MHNPPTPSPRPAQHHPCNVTARLPEHPRRQKLPLKVTGKASPRTRNTIALPGSTSLSSPGMSPQDSTHPYAPRAARPPARRLLRKHTAAILGFKTPNHLPLVQLHRKSRVEPTGCVVVLFWGGLWGFLGEKQHAQPPTRQIKQSSEGD